MERIEELSLEELIKLGEEIRLEVQTRQRNLFEEKVMKVLNAIDELKNAYPYCEWTCANYDGDTENLLDYDFDIDDFKVC